MTTNTFEKTVLPSGMTVLSETLPDRHSVSIGVWVRSGARDEPLDRLGITHFIEHMLFKGTERRDARAIAGSLESLGGHLDAFTGRESVCYYARALEEHLPEVIDVLADIVCRSRFDPRDVEREKSVVREEIFSCEDNPEDKVNELQAEQLWPGHELGRPILGTVETVDRFEQGVLAGYHASRHAPDRLVIAGAGALSHGRLVEEIERRFTPPMGAPLPLSNGPPSFETSARHVVRDDLQQLYLALGTRGVAYGHADRYPLVVLSTLLGGGMSSRLFQSVREEAGLAYSVYSAVEFHRDSGLLTIQLGVAPERGREALARVRQELEALIEHGPTPDEVEAARQQLRGSVLMGQESVSTRMYHLAHEEIYCGRFTPPEEQVERVTAVTGEQVAALARERLDPAAFVLTALGPAPGGPLGREDWTPASRTASRT